MGIHLLHSLLFWCIIIIISSFFITSSTAQPPPPNTKYYQVVFQWPTSFCNVQISTRCVPDPPTQRTVFTLHGVWPDEFNRAKTRKKCHRNPPVAYTRPNQTQQIDLHRLWPNILNASDDQGFWERQWNSHGTCGSLNPAQTFNEAIRLYNAIRINSLMFDQPPVGLGLRIGTSITVDLRARIFNKLGVYPRLSCMEDRTTKRDTLVEVVICYDGQLQHKISCPSNRPNNCPRPGYPYDLP